MKRVEKYVDLVFHAVSKEFPPEFKYHGSRRCTHMEEYKETIRKKTTKSTYDVARSDFYMMQYQFSFEGEKLKPKYIYLPFVTDNCTMHISNGRYLVSPVLADRVITIGQDYIFVRLLRDKMTFERIQHNFRVDDARETVQVVWSNVYHKTAAIKKLKNPLKIKSSLAHYLFCKYGFSETLRLFGHTTPVIGDHTTIDKNTYPEDKWVICRSNQVPPRGSGHTAWVAPTLRIAIPRHEFTTAVKNLVGGFFYVVDYFPEQFRNPEWVNDKQLWMMLMGQIIFSPLLSRGKLINDITTHIASLDDYIDSIMVQKFKEIEMPITDLYQLFALLVENFDTWLFENADKVNSMYDKELNIIGFLLEMLTVLIVKMNFRLKAAAKKGLKKRDVEAALQAVKSGVLFGLVKSSGLLSTTSSPGDNKAFKLTTILIPQTASQKGMGGNDHSSQDDASHRLHVSVAEIGGYSNIPKSHPDGRGRLNPCVIVSDTDQVMRHEDLRAVLDEVQTYLDR
jgi:hypothetical protein